jgi:hypothetical protein
MEKNMSWFHRHDPKVEERLLEVNLLLAAAREFRESAFEADKQTNRPADVTMYRTYERNVLARLHDILK